MGKNIISAWGYWEASVKSHKTSATECARERRRFASWREGKKEEGIIKICWYTEALLRGR